MSVVISGSGLYTPQDTISNEELVNSFNQYVELFNQAHQTEIQNGTCTALEYSSSAFIEKASGIKQRYVVDKVGVLDPKRMRPYIPQRNDSEMSLQCEMSLKAIYPALDQAQVEGHQIDAIIVACSNFQRPYPALAIEIQAALKCHGFGFDMNVACSSATFGIAAAKSLIESGQCQHAIVVNPEICSGHLDFTDRESHFIFGDACTAVVLQNDSAAKVPHFKILDSKLTTQFSNNIRNNNGFLTHTEAKSAELPLHLFKQQGRRVFKEVTPLVAEHILEQLHDLQLSPQHMKRMWLHQANRTMNELICKRVLNTEFREQEAPIILDQYANTSSAGSIISFHNHHADLQAGDRGLICSFGAGYSIGSIVLEKSA